MRPKRVASTRVHYVRGPNRSTEEGTREVSWPAVWNVIKGQTEKLYPNEVCAAIWILRQRRDPNGQLLTKFEIARRIGVSDRTVFRHLRRCSSAGCLSYTSRQKGNQ